MLVGFVTTSASRLRASTAPRTVACRAPRDADVAWAIRFGRGTAASVLRLLFFLGRGRRRHYRHGARLTADRSGIVGHGEGNSIGPPRERGSANSHPLSGPRAETAEVP